jgi:hypothetical protein
MLQDDRMKNFDEIKFHQRALLSLSEVIFRSIYDFSFSV